MDRDKVIKALELCIADIECTDCPYEEECFSMDCEQYAEPMMRDALALLKEQEEVNPFHKCTNNEYTLIEDSGFDFCPYCGKKLLWE